MLGEQGYMQGAVSSDERKERLVAGVTARETMHCDAALSYTPWKYECFMNANKLTLPAPSGSESGSLFPCYSQSCP